MLSRVVAKYCRWDGYPTGQGVYLFDFLHVEGNIARLRAGLAYIYKPTQEELKEFQEALEAEVARLEGLDPMDIYNYLLPRMPPYLDLSILVSEEPREHEIRNLLSTFHQSALLFPSLSGGTGGHLLELIADATAIHKLPVESELEFAASTLHTTLPNIVTTCYANNLATQTGFTVNGMSTNQIDELLPQFLLLFIGSILWTWMRSS